MAVGCFKVSSSFKKVAIINHLCMENHLGNWGYISTMFNWKSVPTSTEKCAHILLVLPLT